MTKQVIVYILILLAGLAGGTAIGFLTAKSKIDAANTTIEQVKAQLAQTDSDMKAAGAKVSRLETELVKSRNELMRKNTEMLRAQTELGRMKSVLDQALGQGQTPAASTPTTTTPAVVTPTRTTAPATTTAGTKEYTIQDGDSLWKIATKELENGMRYKDILALNPGLTENSTLTVGSKIKIPAK